MRYAAIERRLPRALSRYLLDFEARIERAAASLAAQLPDGARVLDAGAGECTFARYFTRHRYTGVDLGIGDTQWDYGKLDALADLEALPFPDASFDGCLNVVTLEHVRHPDRVLAELARVMAPGARLLLVAPHEWEVHQAPHDYFRYTRHGLAMLLEDAGLQVESLHPAGGFFRLLQRRALNALQFFPGLLFPLGLLLFAPAALVLPLLEPLDTAKDFTLGYICVARRCS